MRPKNKQEIQDIRKSGAILSSVLKMIGRELKPGVSGLDIDRKARKMLQENNSKPAFLGVEGGPGVQSFPAVVCVSANDAVVHGIPNETPFKDGDIVGFDFGVNYNGMITDAARTFIVGEVSEKVKKLVKTTQESLDAGIAQIKAGSTTGDIGAAVQKVLEKENFGIVRDLVGHGVGHELHESPEIPNYGFAGTGSTLKEGMTIAVEPMATLGEWRVVIDSSDGWTIRTRDGSLSAHFEDTILVTKNGAEILTR